MAFEEDLGVEDPQSFDAEDDPMRNLAGDMPEEELQKIAERAAQGYESDFASMAEWRENSETAMELATMVSKGGSWPFEGCSNLVMPTVANAVIQFAARAYPAIINDNKPVRARTIGAKGMVLGTPPGGPQAGPQGDAGMMPPPPMPMPGMAPEGPPMGPEMPPDGLMMPPGADFSPATPPIGGMGMPGNAPSPDMPMGGAPQADGGNVDEDSKQKQADRQSDFMSWQLLEQMEEWEAETDTILHILPAIGSAWRKVWYDPGCNRNRSELVHPSKVVINNKCSTVDRLPRISVDFDLYPWEVEERMRDGRWRRTVLDKGADEAEETDDTDDAPLTFVEQLCRIDLDGDGYDEPVIVVYHKSSREIVRIARDYQPEDVYANEEGEIYKIDRFSQYILYVFIPNPAGGVLGLGFGHLLSTISKATNGITNILVDSGILANAGGGFIRKSARIPAKSVNGGLNKWFVSDIPDGVDPFVPFPRPTPDATLFNMLGMLQNAAKEVTSTTDMMMGDLTKNVAPTTALAMIEQGTKVFNAIYKRIYRALKQEYKAIARLNYLFLDPNTLFEWNDSEGMVGPEDFNPNTLDVVPGADPNMVSDMTEMTRVGALQMFMGDPMIDQIKLRRRMLSAMKVGEDMLAPPPPPPPPDPQVQIETAKLEMEQQRLQIEQMRMQMEQQRMQFEMQIKQAEVQIKAQAEQVKAMAVMKPDAAPAPQMPEPVDPAKEAKAYGDMVRADIEKMMAPLNAAKTQAETDLTRAKADAERVKASTSITQTNLQSQKIGLDAARSGRQEDRADRQFAASENQPTEGQ
jgi:chaperonin GroES